MSNFIYQVFLSNTNNLYTAVWLQKTNNNNLKKILEQFSLTVTTTLGQSGPGSNGNEEVLHIPQSSRTGASPSDTVKYNTQNTVSSFVI